METANGAALSFYKPMPVSSFSTAGLRSSERLERVKAYFQAHGAHAEFRSIGPGEFQSAVEVSRLGAIPITSITGSSTVIKTASDDPRKLGDIALHYIHRGAQLITKRHATQAIAAGDAYLLADIAPITTETQGPVEMISLRLPATVLRDWAIVPEEMTARPLSAHSEFGRALTAYLAGIYKQANRGFVLPPRIIADQLFSLLALTCDHPLEQLASHRHALLRRLRMSLRERFCESGLCPQDVADEHRISVRSVYASFQAAGSSFVHELNMLRLEQAAHILDDHRSRKRTVAEISCRVGFSDPSYFALCFKKQFGVTPSTYRGSKT